MSELRKVSVNILVGSATVSRVGFGTPIIVGYTGQKPHAQFTMANGAVLEIVNNFKTSQSIRTGVTNFSFDGHASPTTVAVTDSQTTINYMNGHTIAQVISAVNEATAPITLELISGDDSGAFAFSGGASLTAPYEIDRYLEIRNLDQLVYYDTTDTEYTMLANMFAQNLFPRSIFLLDVATGDAGALLTQNNSRDWYAILTTSTTLSDFQTISTFALSNNKLCFFTSDDTSVLSDSQLVANGIAVAMYIHDRPNDHVEAAIAAANLPKDPGTLTWANQSGIVGQTPSNFSTTQQIEIENARGNTYIECNGLSFTSSGFTLSSTLTYIDQKRSRDWVKSEMENRFLEALVNEEKFSYDDPGLNRLASRMIEVLDLAGTRGVIAAVGSDLDAAIMSNDGVFQYSVRIPTRAEVLESNPDNINNRLAQYGFSYVEAGAIESVVVTGRIVSSL